MASFQLYHGSLQFRVPVNVSLIIFSVFSYIPFSTFFSSLHLLLPRYAATELVRCFYLIRYMKNLEVRATVGSVVPPTGCFRNRPAKRPPATSLEENSLKGLYRSPDWHCRSYGFCRSVVQRFLTEHTTTILPEIEFLKTHFPDKFQFQSSPKPAIAGTTFPFF